eukprot:scaffold80197_cov53-Phaeocystis_antarctica.AAC.1
MHCRCCHQTPRKRGPRIAGRRWCTPSARGRARGRGGCAPLRTWSRAFSGTTRRTRQSPSRGQSRSGPAGRSHRRRSRGGAQGL